MKKPQKHPSKMTTSEAVEHLFHPKIVEGLKKHVREIDAKPRKEGSH
jgi:hypothetical protein